jgi:tRNA(fMet)-specific endonuclease VapC
MADYFLDTNVCIALINGTSPTVRERFRRANDDGANISVSSAVVYELWYGVEKSARREFNTARLETFLSGPFEIVDFDADDATVAGGVRAELEHSGQPIAAYDVLIASQAKRRGATLVTSNVAEFTRVSGLLIEDWALAANKEDDKEEDE